MRVQRQSKNALPSSSKQSHYQLLFGNKIFHWLVEIMLLILDLRVLLGTMDPMEANWQTDWSDMVHQLPHMARIWAMDKILGEELCFNYLPMMAFQAEVIEQIFSTQLSKLWDATQELILTMELWHALITLEDGAKKVRRIQFKPPWTLSWKKRFNSIILKELLDGAKKVQFQFREIKLLKQ